LSATPLSESFFDGDTLLTWIPACRSPVLLFSHFLSPFHRMPRRATWSLNAVVTGHTGCVGLQGLVNTVLQSLTLRLYVHGSRFLVRGLRFPFLVPRPSTRLTAVRGFCGANALCGGCVFTSIILIGCSCKRALFSSHFVTKGQFFYYKRGRNRRLNRRNVSSFKLPFVPFSSPHTIGRLFFSYLSFFCGFFSPKKFVCVPLPLCFFPSVFRRSATWSWSDSALCSYRYYPFIFRYHVPLKCPFHITITPALSCEGLSRAVRAGYKVFCFFECLVFALMFPLEFPLTIGGPLTLSV